jgi:tetratricopeptide (TPR) repeat protein
MMYFQKGEFRQALNDFDVALRLNPNDPEVINWHGDCQLKLGNYAQAIADYRKLISLAPSSADGYESLSSILASCPDAKYRNGKEAIELARKALKYWADEPTEIHSLMAEAYAENGEWDKAVDYQTKAIKANQSSNLEDLEERLELYKHKQPYRLPEVTKPAK